MSELEKSEFVFLRTSLPTSWHPMPLKSKFGMEPLGENLLGVGFGFGIEIDEKAGTIEFYV